MSIATDLAAALRVSDERIAADVDRARWRLHRLRNMVRSMFPLVSEDGARIIVTLAYASTVPILDSHISEVFRDVRANLDDTSYLKMVDLVATARALLRHRTHEHELATDEDWQVWIASL